MPGSCLASADPPGYYDLALLLIGQLERFRDIQPGILVLAVQAVAAWRTLPGRHNTMHHIPHIWPCQHKQHTPLGLLLCVVLIVCSVSSCMMKIALVMLPVAAGCTTKAAS